MKVILTKITLAGEDGRISQNSKEISVAEGTVGDLKEKGFKVCHNGFELSKFYDLYNIGSDTIYLDLVKEEEEEDDVPRDKVSAKNATKDKYYVICNVDGPTDSNTPKPRLVRFPLLRSGTKLQLFPFTTENGSEFRFGICKESNVYREGDETKYYYQLYRYDNSEEYKNCKVTIGDNNVELKDGDVVKLTLEPVPMENGDLLHVISSKDVSEEEHNRQFMDVFKFVGKNAAGGAIFGGVKALVQFFLDA